MNSSDKTAPTASSVSAMSTEEQPIILGNKMARVVKSDRSDVIMVQWDNYPAVPARHLVNVDIKELMGCENIGREVLLSFIDNDPRQPVIIGVMASLIDEIVKMELASDDKQASPQITRDGENVTIAAHHQITLQCGKSSLILREDGKIIVKGVNILSRASASNKIKGGSVEVN